MTDQLHSFILLHIRVICLFQVFSIETQLIGLILYMFSTSFRSMPHVFIIQLYCTSPCFLFSCGKTPCVHVYFKSGIKILFSCFQLKSTNGTHVYELTLTVLKLTMNLPTLRFFRNIVT